MTRTTEMSAARVREQLELYRHMWVLRLLDMAVEELRIDGLLNQPVQAAFGQEAVAIGTAAALRPSDTMTTGIIHLQHAQQIGCAMPLGPAIAAMIGPSFGSDGDEEIPFVASVRWVVFSLKRFAAVSIAGCGTRLRQRLINDGKVTVCVIGERDANSADFAEAAHIAMSWQLPVVFVVENFAMRATPAASQCHRDAGAAGRRQRR